MLATLLLSTKGDTYEDHSHLFLAIVLLMNNMIVHLLHHHMLEVLEVTVCYLCYRVSQKCKLQDIASCL